MWLHEFRGTAGTPPDPAVWRHELGGGGWGDHQRQEYTDSPANAALDGEGHLAITARREADGRITSARLTTQARFTTAHARVEARLKVPGNRGGWTALWMLGADIDDVGWPACGEIDVVEHVGADPGRCHGTAHGPGWSGLEGGIGASTDAGVDLSEQFHDYGVTWSAEGISWFLDGHEYHRLTPGDVPGGWPFDHDFFLVLNLAIGGDWPGNDIDDPELPATVLVEHVRVEPAPSDSEPGGGRRAV